MQVSKGHLCFDWRKPNNGTNITKYVIAGVLCNIIIYERMKEGKGRSVKYPLT